MIFVITGNGKGKTTSALGMLSRALGQGMECAVIQFIKSSPGSCGEYRTFSKLGVDWENWGDGFTFLKDDLSTNAELCRKGWRSFMEKVDSGKYDFIILDELTYTFENNFLNIGDAVSFLSDLKKNGPHIVITGRRAQKELKEIADTVSEINEVKHHYNSNGGKTVRGIEF